MTLMKNSNSIKKKMLILWMMTQFVLLLSSNLLAQIGIWSSAKELTNKPMAGPAWEAVKQAADNANPNAATVSNQDSNNNTEILAAAIVYARTGDENYKNKVIAACEKLSNEGKPADRTLAWARETGAYALAADLVGYRAPQFELWLRNMAENYVASDNRTLLYMFKKRPNNWGTQAFGSLCAIYAYLQDTTRLTEVRDYWIQAVVGPKPTELTYGSDISWHVDPNNLRMINPKGAIKQGLNIDGIVPDDMRRGGSFRNPPEHTGYAWETLQGIVAGARILDRMGMPIWTVADSVIYRAVYALQVRWENKFGGWKAEGDDLWMLPFMDDAYGTNWAEGQPERVWKHGKNVGWPYVLWEESTGLWDSKCGDNPGTYQLYQNYPNPFNSMTKIEYNLAQDGYVRLSLYDLMGRKVSALVDDFRCKGSYSVCWEARDTNGKSIPSGIYLCRFQAGAYVRTIKIMLIQ